MEVCLFNKAIVEGSEGSRTWGVSKKAEGRVEKGTNKPLEIEASAFVLFFPAFDSFPVPAAGVTL